ncbi:MAG: hypothetical protein IKM33_03790 [Clostridia bacterium]|nr:hypothetical protein [Clostridia bacterium]
MKKSAKKAIKNNKKPIIIGAIGAGVVALVAGLGKAFSNMKKSAKAQHEVDKAEFEAAKAEAKASFEENRAHNTYAKAKAGAKQSWDDAHMSPVEREAKMQAERDEKCAAAKEKTKAANARYEAAKKN